MKESIDFLKAKELMKNMNVIIYGTIRDIEEYFTQSFTNLDILSTFFNKTFMIIFENDSSDKTRDILKAWVNTNKSTNVMKHIILEDALVNKIPLRATRLAYCRNQILDYIFQHNYDKEFSYAIHCDLDNRFWGIDFNSVCNSFQYPLDKWDAMTCVNKNKKYYDYWALRVNNCWFNKNIFSCEANWPETNFETKTHEFLDLLNKTTNLLKCNSSFNGLGIYKLSSIQNCRYNSTFHCNKCKNVKQGCFEDNDHIGLHRDMLKNKCNLYINTKMNLLSKPVHALPLNDYIKKYFFFIKNINKNPLLYLLKNNLISMDHLWLDFDTKNGDIVNLLGNYNNNSNKIYTFPLQKEDFTLLNQNLTIIKSKPEIALNIFICKYLKTELISFINFNNHDYFIIKYLLSQLITKIDESCIMIFNNFINYKGYIYNSFKAFYEISQEYQLDFETIGVNGNYDFISNNNIDLEKDEATDNLFSDKIVGIKILKNPNKNHLLVPIKNYLKEYEVMNNNNENHKCLFDWKVYLELNPDLNKEKINCKEKAWKHWSSKGYLEKRYFYFDLQKCIKENNLSENITNIEAIQTCSSNYKKYSKNLPFNEKKNVELVKKYKTELFDWEYYVKINKDLKNLTSYLKAWNHFILHGEKENRITNNFNWLHYLILNPDVDLLKLENLDEEMVFQHYLNYGIEEKRKYYIK